MTVSVDPTEMTARQAGTSCPPRQAGPHPAHRTRSIHSPAVVPITSGTICPGRNIKIIYSAFPRGRHYLYEDDWTDVIALSESIYDWVVYEQAVWKTFET